MPYSPSCPNCGSQETFFDATTLTWFCESCGLADAPIEDWRGFKWGETL